MDCVRKLEMLRHHGFDALYACMNGVPVCLAVLPAVLAFFP